MDTTNSRCAAEAGQHFVEWYYPQINAGKPVASAYTTNNEAYKQASHPPSDICVNGLVLATPEELEKTVEKSRTWTGCPADRTVRYVVESFNTSVVNGDYKFAAPQNLVDIHSKNDGVRLMISLSVSGTVYYGVDRHSRDNVNYAVKKHFNDLFLLVPNWEVIGRNSKNKAVVGRRYIVASHTHRAFDE
ncbi:hypothetical protein QBC44DRAFT_19880 [Cladorrhinum sp. PSN332]|nr:hypothetical protein QBC44DRAFT_19880 [Cladorrhinum sp. PSN332]